MVGKDSISGVLAEETCAGNVKLPAMSACRCLMAESSSGEVGLAPSIAVARIWVALTIQSAGDTQGI